MLFKLYEPTSVVVVVAALSFIAFNNVHLVMSVEMSIYNIYAIVRAKSSIISLLVIQQNEEKTTPLRISVCLWRLIHTAGLDILSGLLLRVIYALCVSVSNTSCHLCAWPNAGYYRISWCSTCKMIITLVYSIALWNTTLGDDKDCIACYVHMAQMPLAVVMCIN